MALPLDVLLDFDGNSYEIVVAAIKRAQQLTDIKVAYNPTTLEEHGDFPVIQPHPEIMHEDKTISTAFNEIFNKSVTYKITSD